jgi:hypothetical protein
MSKSVPLNSLTQGQHFEFNGSKGLLVERLPSGIKVMVRERNRTTKGSWHWVEHLWTGSMQVEPDRPPPCQPIRTGIRDAP